jgi:hypothetical protein
MPQYMPTQDKKKKETKLNRTLFRKSNIVEKTERIIKTDSK